MKHLINQTADGGSGSCGCSSRNSNGGRLARKPLHGIQVRPYHGQKSRTSGSFCHFSLVMPVFLGAHFFAISG